MSWRYISVAKTVVKQSFNYTTVVEHPIGELIEVSVS